MNTAEAYRHCQLVTNREARNFSYGIRLLPPVKRAALSAIYAFSRRVDDVADGSLPTDQKLTALAQVREDLDTLGRPTEDAVLVALGDAASRYPVPRSALGDLVDGVEMDVVGTRYGTFEELVVYCRRVAGAVGQLSLAVFGARDVEAARPRADALGVALQLTNILRDVREDAEMGRVYLPAGDLERFGWRAGDELPWSGAAVGSDLAGLVRFEAERAEQWFGQGLELLSLLDRRSRACTAAMAGIYRRLLARIARHPEAVSAGRVSLPPWEKAWVASASLAGSAP
ncbi:MAG TPA: presqualene diphosphate synthase HpnD [Acidimicrobiales bacterium]